VALAHQSKSQITRYFTTQMLYYHKLKSDSEDYKYEQVRSFDLPSLFVVLKRFFRVAERGYFGFYTETYFSVFLTRKSMDENP
jgi:hypothetical protein